MRLSRLSSVVLGAVGVLVAFGCASTPREATPLADSAAALERSPCPQDLRVGLEGIDAAADWRQVGEPGLRYCVPATWISYPHPQGDEWRATNVSVAAAYSSRIESDFPRMYQGNTARRAYFQQEIGGYEAEFWYQEFQRADHFAPRLPRAGPQRAGNDSRSVARLPKYASGYQTFAVWRDADVVMSG
jgi:hypothetical protein